MNNAVKRSLILVLILAVAGGVGWIVHVNSIPPTVAFARTARGPLTNVVSTNGKVEPVEYTDVRVESGGLVKRLLVAAGATVAKGQVLAELSTPGIEDEIAAAEAREAQARAELSTLRAGGRPADVSEIDGSLRRLRADREAAQKNLDSLERLAAKQAATPYEAAQARQAIHSLDVQMEALEQRRGALIAKGDVEAAEARLREAQLATQALRNREARSLIHAPMAGTLYDLPARAGSFLNAGDAVGRIGKLDPVRVRVYVDEPELGRVALNQKVRITWDGLTGREWNGVVATLPTEVVALNARQVGEVLCTIENPGRELTPGTNINAFILTQVVDNALSIPKAALRHTAGTGVYLLQPDNTVKWQPVTTGIADALRVEIRSGLKDGDVVSTAADQTFSPGDHVTPAIQ